MSRDFSTEAIVLGSNKLGEADRVVTLLTALRGKVPTVVKGVRKIKSRFGGRLEPFSHLQVQLFEGRNLHTLTGADTIATHAASRDNPASLRAGLAVIDLISRSIPEYERRPRTFNLLVNFLNVSDSFVSSNREPLQFSLLAVAAQLKLLLLFGYLPHMSSCAVCGAQGELEHFSGSAGGAVCRECGSDTIPLTAAAVDSMRFLLEEPLAAVAELEIDEATIMNIWQLIRETCRFQMSIDLKLAPGLPVRAD